MQSRTRLKLERGYEKTYVQERERARDEELKRVYAVRLPWRYGPGWKEWYGEVILSLAERPRRLAFDGILTKKARVCMRLVLKLPRAVAMALSAGAVTMRSQP